jgi:hypothetical protein
MLNRFLSESDITPDTLPSEFAYQKTEYYKADKLIKIETVQAEDSTFCVIIHLKSVFLLML